MHKKTTESFLLESGLNPNINHNQSTVNQIQNINPQVKAEKLKIIRRKFSTADKLKFIEEYDACASASVRGELLRKKGLYYASITKWKKQLSDKNSNHGNSKAYKLTLEHNQLIRENAKLKKKLSQAEAIIELQKKVSELLSNHVLDQEMSELKS